MDTSRNAKDRLVLTRAALSRAELTRRVSGRDTVGPDLNRFTRQVAGRKVAGRARLVVARHPVAWFLVTAYTVFWLAWLPVLFLDGSPRVWTSVGVLLGLTVPAYLITAVTEGRAGVRDLLHRTLRWRVSGGWYVFAGLAVPGGALLLAALVLGQEPLARFGLHLPALFTAFLPQLLWAVLTVQLFEEVGWAGFVQHRLQERHGALKAALLAGVAFAFLHLPTYMTAPVSPASAVRSLAVLVVVIPFALVFRILIAYTYNRTGYAVFLAAITHASFNEASEVISPAVQGPLGQVFAFSSTALLAVLVIWASRGALGRPRS